MQQLTDNYLQSFADVLQVKFPFSINTHKTYLSLLRKFLSEYKGNIDRANAKQLTAYISTMQSNSVMAQMHGVLKNFYAFVLNQPLKFKYIPRPKKEHRLPFAPQHEQVLQIIEDELNLKHKCILALFYGTGIRLSELTEARWKDIQRVNNLDNPLTIHIRGKGKKDRIVPLSKYIYDLLIAYSKEFKINSKCKECYIFEGIDGKYSNRSAHEVVKRAGVKHGLNISPHKLRHACFRTMRSAGTDLSAIQKLAGHENIKTTGMYSDMLPEKITMPL